MGIQIEPADLSAFKTDYSAETGKVIFAGSEEEKNFRDLVSKFVAGLSSWPPDRRRAFRRFVADPSSYSTSSPAHSNVFVRSVGEQYRRLAEKYPELSHLSRAVVSSLARAQFKNHELNTLRDIAAMTDSAETRRIGEGLLRLITTKDGLRPGFQLFLMGLQTEVKVVDMDAWRRSLGRLEDIAAKAGDEPRFQDIWLSVLESLPRTAILQRNLRKLFSGPPAYEMFVRTLPLEVDANDARKMSMAVLLRDGETDLVAFFLNYLFSRRAGRALLDGVIHAAAMRPLVPVSRELLTRAVKEMEHLTNSRHPDFRSEFMRTAGRVWNHIRPIFDKKATRKMVRFTSADTFLKEHYGRKSGGGSGKIGNGGQMPLFRTMPQFGSVFRITPPVIRPSFFFSPLRTVI